MSMLGNDGLPSEEREELICAWGEGFHDGVMSMTKTPDPETGLVPCGCGGKGEEYYVEHPYSEQGYYIVCNSCPTQIYACPDAESAKETWNTAMGYRKGPLT